MKKIGTLLTIFVLAALALAACGGGGTGNTTPGAITTPGAGEGGGLTTGTPGAGLETGTPASGAATATVPAAGGVTGTPEAGAATPTAGADLTSTPAAGAGTTTPVAGVPVTGEHQFALLSQVLKARVETGSTGSAAGGTQELGTVYGVVINSLAASPGTGTDTGATATAAPGVTTTPTTGGADTTATPASGAGAGTDAGSDALTGPAISYLLVNANASGAGSDTGTGAGAATSTPGADTGSATSTPGADTATTTPAANSAGSGSSASVAGQVVAIPWGAVNANMSTGFAKSGAAGAAGETVLVVTVDTDAVAGAPAFDDSAVTGADWDAEIASYWAGKGLTIPVTGMAANQGQPVVIRGSLPNMNVTGAHGKVLGQVRDFVVDLTTGQLAYAVLSGGSAFGGNFYLVPLTVFTWQAGQGQGQGQGNSLGDFTTSIPAAVFQSAPNLAALDTLDFSAPDWNMTTDQYWAGQGATK